MIGGGIGFGRVDERALLPARLEQRQLRASSRRSGPAGWAAPRPAYSNVTGSAGQSGEPGCVTCSVVLMATVDTTEQRRQERGQDHDRDERQDERSAPVAAFARRAAGRAGRDREPSPAGARQVDRARSIRPSAQRPRRRSRPSAARARTGRSVMHERDREQEPGQRRPVGHVLEREEVLVDVEVVEERRPARLAGPVLEDERHEEVLEHLDHAEHQRVEDDRRHHRDGDVAESRPGAGAVDPGRVVQLGRDALEPGEVDDHRRRRSPRRP